MAPWTRDPQGIYFGGNDMAMTPRQMLAFGELYLREGRVGATQVLPAQWIRDSWVPRGRSLRGDRDDREYGYGWWMRTLAGQRTYYAWGFGGQFIFVVPALELVVVTTSSTATDDERRDAPAHGERAGGVAGYRAAGRGAPELEPLSDARRSTTPDPKRTN